MIIFEQQLYFGKVGESLIAKWMIRQGWNILPVYEKEKDSGKGPVVYTLDHNIIAPDMLAYQKENLQALWIEAKTKNSFTWHRISKKWVTGIDLRHYNDYLYLLKSSPWPIWLMFLHLKSDGAKDTPTELIGHSPVGLFGNLLDILSKHENHRHDNWGTSGMVYWCHDDLLLLATIDEIQSVDMQSQS